MSHEDVTERRGAPEEPGSAAGAASGELWQAVERLLDGAPDEGILAHKLAPLAAGRLRRLGLPIPQAFRELERSSSLAMLTARPLVQLVRDSCDGPLVLIKGPEVACLYPPNGRRFTDVDVLAPQAEAVQQSLLSAGFRELPEEDPAGHHHLTALGYPTMSLSVEVHARPNWPAYARPPRVAEILEASGPSLFGVDGVLAPSALHHALILASHAWTHLPLQTLRDLIDIAAVSAPVDPGELERTATAWDLGRIWQTTRRAIDALFYGAPPTMPLRTWARHLAEVRERTVFESHLERWLSNFWAMPLRQALGRTGRVLWAEVSPLPGETWGDKLGRVPAAMRDARRPMSGR